MGKPTWLLMFLLVVRHIQESTQLTINSINVPSIVKAGEDYVILDCDYDLEDTSSDGLVVKWYLNSYQVPNSNVLAYQWIYKREPQATEIVEKYIDLKYKASNDPRTMYRAMKLNKPNIDLSGEYICIISTFADEKISSKKMLIYSTEDKFELTYRKKSVDGKNGVELTCIAEGVYPQPTLNIAVKDNPMKQVVEPIVTNEDGQYNILSRVALKDEDLQDPAIFKCVLSIPEVNYDISREIVYYPGPPTTTSTTTSTTKPPRKMETQALNNSQPGLVNVNGGGNSAVSTSPSIAFTMTKFIALIYIVLGFYSCD